MEYSSAENRSNRFVMCSFRQRCSTCGCHGHNSRTCDVERMREYELEFATATQNIEVVADFETWLSNTYDYHVLKAFAITKCGVINSVATLTTCIHAIGTYIYNKYRFQYVSESNESIESEFINDMAQIIAFTPHQRIAPPSEEAPSEEDLTAALNNDISSSIYFETLFRYLSLQNYGRMLQSTFQESSLIRRYNIENVLEEAELDEEKVIECCICYDEYKRQDCVTFGCNHEFCKDCTKKALRAKQCCAYCRAPVAKLITRIQEVHDEIGELVV
jgi:hypothetical protein